MTRTTDEKELDRRKFLKCMAWVGTGAVWTMSSGVLKGSPLGQRPNARSGARQRGTAVRADQRQPHRLRQAGEHRRDRDAARGDREDQGAPEPPAFVLHTGDLTHLSKPAEFDTLQQVLSELSVPVFYVPGEHDVLDDDGKSYLQRFGKGTHGAGWHSFDQSGVHFIGLVNVVNLKAGGLGSARRRATRMAREGRQAAEEQHADRRLRAHSALVGLSRMGLGHRRQRAARCRT